MIYSNIFSISAGLRGDGHSGRIAPSCSTAECQRIDIIICSSLGGIFGLALLICCIALCYEYCKDRPIQKNSNFVNFAHSKQFKEEVYEANAFQSGIWSSRYFQYGKWHGPHQLSLSFDSQSLKVTGSGSDDVGTFTVDGTYSVKTRRIGLTKTYQAGTGNRSKNLGHQVTIQLAWNAQNNQFEGKWYIQTSKYRGEDKVELKFYKQQELSAYEKV